MTILSNGHLWKHTEFIENKNFTFNRNKILDSLNSLLVVEEGILYKKNMDFLFYKAEVDVLKYKYEKDLSHHMHDSPEDNTQDEHNVYEGNHEESMYKTDYIEATKKLNNLKLIKENAESIIAAIDLRSHKPSDTARGRDFAPLKDYI